jgi:Ca-activated chloride channel family protein
MNLSFLYPNYLWFLASIPFLIALHIVSLRFTRRKALLFANFEAIRRVEGGFLSGSLMTKNLIFLVMRSLTLLFLVLSLAGAVLWYQGRGSNLDFVLAVDASGSMLADDFVPNRLEAAKDSALLFLEGISSHSKVGVMSFSGTTFVKQRLTSDMDLVRNSIKAIDIEFASGTAIGDTVISASNIFEDDDNARVVALITDGQNNVGVLPEEAVRYANKNHITIYTIGVATEQGGKFKDIEALSKLDEATLISMAQGTGGSYFRATDKESLRSAFTNIALSTEKTIPMRLSIPFLISALILLFAEWLMINTRYRTIP